MTDTYGYGPLLKIVSLLLLFYIILNKKYKNTAYLITFLVLYALASFLFALHLKYVESKLKDTSEVKLDAGIYESYTNVMLCLIALIFICCMKENKKH